jgi:hypothetical protein
MHGQPAADCKRKKHLDSGQNSIRVLTATLSFTGFTLSRTLSRTELANKAEVKVQVCLQICSIQASKPLALRKSVTYAFI